ncbi:hypothetical protein DEO72_LG10g3033 [Vigna unguiculata]|uniref:Uncharacterized protein n=1 Tax=Vigna unguiculata TaxID=3917 RepID=A0A4D6NDG7_VIGUN|nr:hypothetical protein DEO72_LG10g3033 [Vigna unguiculata]
MGCSCFGRRNKRDDKEYKSSEGLKGSNKFFTNMVILTATASVGTHGSSGHHGTGGEGGGCGGGCGGGGGGCGGGGC